MALFGSAICDYVHLTKKGWTDYGIGRKKKVNPGTFALTTLRKNAKEDHEAKILTEFLNACKGSVSQDKLVNIKQLKENSIDELDEALKQAYNLDLSNLTLQEKNESREVYKKIHYTHNKEGEKIFENYETVKETFNKIMKEKDTIKNNIKILIEQKDFSNISEENISKIESALTKLENLEENLDSTVISGGNKINKDFNINEFIHNINIIIQFYFRNYVKFKLEGEVFERFLTYCFANMKSCLNNLKEDTIKEELEKYIVVNAKQVGGELIDVKKAKLVDKTIKVEDKEKNVKYLIKTDDKTMSKIDVQIEFKDSNKETMDYLNFSAKSISVETGKYAHIKAGEGRLYDLLENLEATNFITHYLNIYSEHYRFTKEKKKVQRFEKEERKKNVYEIVEDPKHLKNTTIIKNLKILILRRMITAPVYSNINNSNKDFEAKYLVVNNKKNGNIKVESINNILRKINAQKASLISVKYNNKSISNYYFLNKPTQYNGNNIKNARSASAERILNLIKELQSIKVTAGFNAINEFDI